MGNITSMSGMAIAENGASEDVIKILENALAMAKRGELSAVSVCGATPSGKCYDSWAISAHGEVLIAALDISRHTLLAVQVASRMYDHEAAE